MEDLKEFKEKFPKLYKAISEQGRNDQRAVQRTVDAAKAAQEKKPEPALDPETRWNKAWDADPELRAEFGQKREIWISYCQANSKGRASTCTGGQTQFSRGDF